MRRGGRQVAGISDGPGDVALSRASEDDFILRSSVSKRRKAAFLDDFLTQRRDTRVIEMLFERVGAFHLVQTAPPPDVEPVGFKGIVFKGPFVDRSDWHQGSGWDFAVPMERHLLLRLDKELRAATDGRLGTDVEREARALVRTFDELARELVSASVRPSLFVLAGDLGTQLYIDLTREVIPDWDPRVEAALYTTYRIMGMYHDVPILELPDSQVPAVYALDLAQFATLTRYRELPDFKIEEFSEDRAREILARQPRLIMEPPPNSGLDDERVRQLQLRVGLDLWETYELTVTDPNAVVGRPLVGPILD